MFSVKLGDIRQERIDHERRHADGDTTLLVGEWSFAGIGHLSEGDRWLAAEGGRVQREVYVEWRKGML